MDKDVTEFKINTVKGKRYPWRCWPCYRMADKRWRDADENYREKRRMQMRAVLERDPDHYKKLYLKFHDACLRKSKAYYARHPGLAGKRKKEWREKNPEKNARHKKDRQILIDTATPMWADQSKIREIYLTARKENKTVDHMVPLKSRLVCGLHVHHNLAVIHRQENMRKSNIFWPDMPE